MRSNRRRFATGVASIGTFALAGCLKTGSLGSGEENTAGQDLDGDVTGEESNSPEENSGDEENETAEEEPDPPETFDAPHESIQGVVDFTKWKVTRLETAIDDYRDGLYEVKSILEDYSDRDVSSLSKAELDVLFEAAQESTNTDSGLRQYYDSHPNLSAYARKLQSDVQRNFDRSEYGALEEVITQQRRTYSYLSSSSYTDEAFGRDPISGDSYNLFKHDIQSENAEHVFEVLYQPNSTGSQHSFFVASGPVRFLNEPFNLNEEGEIETLRYRTIPVYEFADGLVDLEDYSMTEIYLNITRLSLFNKDYPESYTEGQSTLDMRGSEGVGMVIQELGSVSAAQEVYQSYLDAGTKDSNVELMDYEWERVFFKDQQPTVYAHIMRRGNYVILLDVVDAQWEDREFGDSTEITIDDILSQTFLD